MSPVSTIKEIISRPHDTLGEKRILKMVLIATKYKTAEHTTILNEIRADPETSSKVEVWVVNAKKENESFVNRFKDLEKNMETDLDLRKRLLAGCLVVIGQGCFSAGISMSPPPGVKIEFTQEGVSYQLLGLTDQIARPVDKDGKAKNMEKNIQSMRLCDYYPKGIGPTLWVDGETIEDFQLSIKILTGRGTGQHLVNQYKGSPHSIADYISTCRFELYKNSQLVLKDRCNGSN